MDNKQGASSNMIIAGVVVAIVVVLGVVMVMNNSKKSTDTTMMKNEPTMAPENAMTGGDSMKEEGVMVGGAAMLPSRDIVDNAMLASNVTTVVAAVKAADLVETLKGPGPFTVFAPTNAAFEKLPAGTVDSLLLPENKAKLTGILTYHVVPGRYTSADLKDGMTLKTVNGQMLTVKMMDGKWMVNDAMVETADVISSNGVTFVIDSVLMPK